MRPLKWRLLLSPLNFQLTDRGTEYCGKVETHDYELYLGLNDIEHARTKARHPQTNGLCESFHKTILQEFYQPAFRRSFIPHWKSCKETLTRLA